MWICVSERIDMNCKCGFKFSGPGEIRDHGAFVTDKGQSGVVCPECETAYVDGREVEPIRKES